jgi:hypothetical protein
MASSHGMANAKSQRELNASFCNADVFSAAGAPAMTVLSLGFAEIERLLNTGVEKLGSMFLISPMQRWTPFR